MIAKTRDMRARVDRLIDCTAEQTAKIEEQTAKIVEQTAKSREQTARLKKQTDQLEEINRLLAQRQGNGVAAPIASQVAPQETLQTLTTESSLPPRNWKVIAETALLCLITLVAITCDYCARIQKKPATSAIFAPRRRTIQRKWRSINTFSCSPQRSIALPTIEKRRSLAMKR